MNNNLTICICNYNTTELTNNAIQSIIYWLPKNIHWKMLILDNSDEQKFILKNNDERIQIIDNTFEKYINFNNIIKYFCNIPVKHSNNASLKHCYSIQWLLNICTTRDMLLCDSDIIVNSKINFINKKYITIAAIQENMKPTEKSGKSFGKPYLAKTRFLPYIQYFNCQKIKYNNINYFNPTFMHGGLTKDGNQYDTGAFFYKEIIEKAPTEKYKIIDYHNYITHFGAESWKKFDVMHKYV